jgi:murein DD-endopeptidase MepM/ murein hydrolase activator NlpD
MSILSKDKMVRETTATLEGLATWRAGESLISVEVTLGQQERSSNCTVTIADPGGKIAAQIINHTLESGGIPGLPNDVSKQPSSAIDSKDVTNEGDGGAGVVSRGQGFTPNILAFLDLIAVREVGGYTNGRIDRSWYFRRLGGQEFSEQEASQGYPKSSGNKASGRYQIIPKTWGYINERNPGKFNDFLPESQDRAAYWLLQQRKMVAPINAGDIEAAIILGRNEWTSLPGAAEQQSGWTLEKAKEYYKQRLTYYNGKSLDIQVSKAREEELPEEPPEIVKGNKLIILLDGIEFVFFHQSTKTNQDSETTLTGQGIRWVMNRRKRNKTIQDVTLKQLAQAVATAHRITLDYQATFNPEFLHIDQSGITDYQLLVREANQAGLVVSEENGKLTVKSRLNIVDTGFLVAVGANLLRYEVEDKALDQSQEVSGLLQDETKAIVDPLTGRLTQTLPDIDPVKDKSSTGRQAPNVAATPKPGQDAQMTTERSRIKRLKGLPSTFTILKDLKSILLKPMDAVRTQGLPGVLSRIWAIDEVTHKEPDGTTTLKCYSPVQVIDSSYSDPNSAGNTGTITSSNVPSGTWVYPATGTVTSLYGLRRAPTAGASSNHRGVDIANVLNTPILASQEGVVITASAAGKAGNLVEIKHPNGYVTQYMHNQTFKCRVGEQVKTGQLIALMGQTGGFSTGVHCHFGVKDANGNFINPSTILSKLNRITNSVIGGTN